MYRARLTRQGAERYGIPERTNSNVYYESIHPAGKSVQGVELDGKSKSWLLGFVGEDRSVELITWPEGLDYEGG